MHHVLQFSLPGSDLSGIHGITIAKPVHGSSSPRTFVNVASSFLFCFFFSEKLCNIVAIPSNKKFNMLELTGDIMLHTSLPPPAARSSNKAAITAPSSLLGPPGPWPLFIVFVGVVCHRRVCSGDRNDLKVRTLVESSGLRH